MHSLTDLQRDVRTGLRRLLRQPGFAVVAVFTLALGIGANTAMFSLVRGVLLRPLPYDAPDRLVMFWNPEDPPTEETWFSVRELAEYRAALRGVTDVAAYDVAEFGLTGEGEPERVAGARVTANAFSALGVRPLAGRVLMPEDDVAGAGVVVISHELWQRRFHEAEVVGRVLHVNGEPHTIVGVMPPQFRLPMDYRSDATTQLWVPAALDAAANPSFGNRYLHIFARLDERTTAEALTMQMRALPEQWLSQGLTRADERMRARAAMPLEALLLRDIRPALLMLFGAVALVLLMACVNVMHLQLAAGAARAREIGTAAALGATRGRLIRQLLVESGVIGALGAAAGCVVAWLVLRGAVALAPVHMLRMRDVGLDATVLGFTALLALLATLIGGLAPALQLSRVDVSRAMSGTRGESGTLRAGMRRLLIVTQTALAVVVLVGGGLLVRSLLELRSTDLGFDADNVLTARLAVPETDYADPARVSDFYATLLQQVQAMPGVEAAAATRLLPLTGTIGDWSITIENREARPDDDFNGDWQVVTPGYFDAMRIRAAHGRLPAAMEGTADGPLVAVINRTMAERYWPAGAVGRRFHLGSAEQPWVEIIGVADDVRHNGLVEDARAEMYLMHAQWPRVTDGSSPRRGMTLVIRTDGDPMQAVAGVRAVVRQLDPNLALADVRTLREVVNTAMAQPRFASLLLGAFAVLALLLAAVGLYGIMAFVTGRRTRELGIRVALGATAGQNLRLLVGEALLLAGAGAAAGAIAALWLGSLIEAQLHGVSASDPLTFAGTILLVVSVAAVAAGLPARRALRVNPAAALTAS